MARWHVAPSHPNRRGNPWQPPGITTIPAADCCEVYGDSSVAAPLASGETMLAGLNKHLAPNDKHGAALPATKRLQPWRRQMRVCVTAAVLLTILMSPAFAQNQGNGNGNGRNGPHAAPGPILGAGLPILAVGFGVYWLVKRRRETRF
jgi:hypothetical protein